MAVLFDTDPACAAQRNRARTQPVPAPVLDAQLRRMRDVAEQLAWPRAGPPSLVRRRGAVEPRHSPGSREAASSKQTGPRSWSSSCRSPGSAGTTIRPGGFDPWPLPPRKRDSRGIALMDHLIQIPQVGRAWEPIPEPWVTLGFLAGLDTGLRLGTLVSPVTFRAPGILAKTAATLDALSGGRAFCGIGAGWWDREHAAFGLPFPPPATRLELLRGRDRDTARPVAAGYQGLQRRARQPAGDHVLSAPGVLDPGDRRRHGASGRCGSLLAWPTAATSVGRRGCWMTGSRCCGSSCERAGRDLADVAITVLDTRSSAATVSTRPRSSESLRGPGERGVVRARATMPASPPITSAATGCWPSEASGLSLSRCPT